MLSVIIPANNEEAWLGPCLAHLAAQDLDPEAAGGAEVIVAANACTDATVAVAEAARPALESAGWALVVLDIAEGGKLNALNRADAVARGTVLAYLDADVMCSPALMGQIVEALATPEPRYASGTLQVAPARSFVTRCYARVWPRLPFMQTNVPGAGLFCMNRAGRDRWGAFPDIIADDGYARLMFAPEERQKVPATYTWPLVEGFANLVRVRRRQDAGVRELEAAFPEIIANESKPPMTARDHLRLFAGTPAAYTVYIAVMLTVKLGHGRKGIWNRGR